MHVHQQPRAWAVRVARGSAQASKGPLRPRVYVAHGTAACGSCCTANLACVGHPGVYAQSTYYVLSCYESVSPTFRGTPYQIQWADWVSVRRYVMYAEPARWSVGLMDKASASGAGDSRFESWADHAPAACDLVAVCHAWPCCRAVSSAWQLTPATATHAARTMLRPAGTGVVLGGLLGLDPTSTGRHHKNR